MMLSLEKLLFVLLLSLSIVFLSVLLSGVLSQQTYAQTAAKTAVELSQESTDTTAEEEEMAMSIRVESEGKTIVFKLNDSSAAESFYEQLPMTVEVENYSNNEKIFYPANKLNVSDTPLVNAKEGTLGYYAPWGDVIMFYSDFGSASGLYELGEVVSGGENIISLSGTIEIHKNK
ncbi:cyclophilin-like fold protein [Halanaerobium sp. ST460_2HS_T2]|jgi:hypothetical protein|uniref:cyclophilin-like fold protein n=1 Tax=Halanaerobium sp. ST460_2HS_T2 TaxID=2183914 RepID=UPI000E05B05D|nr:cyclophilin-like fold protein [Halanaerobium sp. ST460_2HS_T2]RCW62424.1 hypothetical protein DFR80_101229 [Halanaerobium sp. ST460_2HS_T2]